MQRGFTPILILVIGAILVVGLVGGYLFGQNKINLPISGGQKACTLEAMICPDGTGVGRTGPNCEFAACPPFDPLNTTNWKTYKNEKFLFQINYPANSAISELVPGRHVISKLNKNLITDELYISDIYDAGMEIQVFSNTAHLSSKDAARNFEDDFNLKNMKETLIDGKKGVTYSAFKGDHTDSEVSVAQGLYQYILSCPESDPNMSLQELQSRKKLCEEILASFKFN